jgi:CAAX protease family protein
MPVVMTLSYLVLRLMEVPVPVPHITLLSALTLFLIFFIGALGEELGWSGYAIDPMQ